jgi:pSer/pThr/pTyr-binding forkhead associated (FHA) protein
MIEKSGQIVGVLIKDPDASERQTFPVEQDFHLTIGRAYDNNICLTDVMVQRHHCRIYVEEGQIYLIPGSHNTWVNGTGVRERCRLKYGDVIVVGRTVFSFEQPAASFGADGAPEYGEA